MNAIYAIMMITFKEGVRSRVLYGVFLLALLFFSSSLLLSGMMMRDIVKATIDLSLSVISLVCTFVVIFVGINLLSKDIDRKTIYIVLSKPITSIQYILGKYFGINLLLLFSLIVLAMFGYISVLSVKLIYPNYFSGFSLTSFAVAIIFIYLKTILLCSVVILFSSFMTSSFLSLVMSIFTYTIGISLTNVRELISSSNVVGIQPTRIFTNIIETLFYIFPNFSFFDMKSEAAYGVLLDFPHYLTVSLYFIVYSIFLIFLSSCIFSRRQFQ